MAKKKQEPINELENAGNGTDALNSLQPNSHPSDDPKTKFQVISNVLGALAQMSADDINKFNATLAQIGHEADSIPGGAAAQNAATIAMKPSAATSAVKEAVKADIETLLANGEGLTEEFKEQASTLFEAAINARIQIEEARLEEEFNTKLDEAVVGIVEEIAQGVDNYLDHVSKEWLVENEVAIDSSLRNEIYSDLIDKMRNVFEESYIAIPEAKVDIAETLAEKVDELENSLSEMINENSALRQTVEQYTRQETINQVCEGLTLNEAEKLRELAEGIEDVNSETFAKKLVFIKESNFVKAKNGATVITETLEEVSDENLPPEEKTFISPEMKKYSDAISRYARK